MKIRNEKNEFYNEIANKLRTPKIPDKFEIDYPEIVKILRDTWKILPESRPSSQDIRRSLIKIISQMQ